jgi:hypothetical protein
LIAFGGLRWRRGRREVEDECGMQGPDL